MKVKFLAAALAASSVIAAPVAAAAAPPANPAASLSVAKGARAGTPAARGSRIAEGGTATLVNIGILAALAAIVLVATTTGGDDADSN